MTDLTGVTEREVRAVFDDAVSAVPLRLGRLAEVDGRVRRVRRRRSAAGASMVALGLVASAVLVGHRAGSPPAPTAASGPSIPTYRSGGRLVASVVSHDANGVALTFTPTSLDLQLFSGCASSRSSSESPTGSARTSSRSGADETTVQITVNGAPLGGGGCDAVPALTSLASGMRPESWAALGVRVGQPMTVGYSAVPGKHPNATTWAMAVYQDVPVESYVFPPAPAPLPTVDPAGSMAHPETAPVLDVGGQGAPAQPNGLTEVTFQRDATVTVKHGLLLLLDASVPGDLEIRVNGAVIWTPKSWSYGGEGAQRGWTPAELGLRPGQSATISVIAHRYLGATWHLTAYDAAQ